MTASTIARVIVGVDERDRSLDAVALARSLAGPSTELVLATSLPYEPLPVSSEAWQRALEQDAREIFERAEPGLAGLDVRHHVAGGDRPARMLNDLAEQESADVIVVGSSERGAIGRVLPGSVGERLLAAAPCVVAVAPVGLAAQAPLRLGVVGLAFDGSEEARRALEVAAELARERDAKLRLVSVFVPPEVGSPESALMAISELGGEPADDVAASRRDELERAVGAAMRSLPDDVEAIADERTGQAAESLIEVSAELDLLILGSRGYGPIRRVLLGGVSGVVIREARCPALVVPRGAERP